MPVTSVCSAPKRSVSIKREAARVPAVDLGVQITGAFNGGTTAGRPVDTALALDVNSLFALRSSRRAL